jgi:bifunctional aspartokinase / homoserine dehydrogenase 1
MKVLKFGGTSVGTPETIKSLIAILKDYYQKGEHFTVVFSAFSKVTDLLIDMATKASKGDETYTQVFEQVKKRHFDAIDQLLTTEIKAEVEAKLELNFKGLSDILHGIFLIREVSSRTSDFVVSFGERNSAFIIAHALQAAGIPSEFLDARKVIKTDNNFSNAKVDFNETNHLIQSHYASHPKVQVVTGFVGSTTEGITTTLGRGGSDYTAAIFGAALSAEAIEIWTDVDGVLTADPRKVKKAFTLPTMTYREAMEMSHFGQKYSFGHQKYFQSEFQRNFHHATPCCFRLSRKRHFEHLRYLSFDFTRQWTFWCARHCSATFWRNGTIESQCGDYYPRFE